MKPRSHISCSWECTRVWGNEPPHSQVNSPLGVVVSMNSQIFRGKLHGSKLTGLQSSLYHWKTLETYMFKMGSHDPFGNLKHKLWPKEGLKVKSSIWIPVKVKNFLNFLACRYFATYFWKSLDEGYNFALDLTSIEGLHTKLWAPKITGVQFKEFWDSNLRISGQNGIWVLALWPSTKNIIKGKWWPPPNPSCDESCEFVFAHGLSMHQKCSNYTLINLFGLCRSMWIIDLLVILPSPHHGALTRPSTPKVLWVRERAPTLYPFVVHPLDS
jgi:hypothetical protein